MQVRTAEICEDDFNIIRRIVEKYHFMKAIGLKQAAVSPIKIHLMWLDPEPKTMDADAQNLSKPTHGWNPSVYEWLVSKCGGIPAGTEQIESPNISENVPTNPATKKLYPTGKNTGLNGGYWSATDKCIKRKTSVKDVVRSFKSCEKCHFNGTKKVMIKCNQCIRWFHRKCVNASNDENYKENYFCNSCQRNANKAEKKCLLSNAASNQEYYNKAQLYKGCPCGNSGTSEFMIACDGCQRWFHGRCVKLSKKKSLNLDKYYCGPCIVKNLKFKITCKV